MTGFNTSAVIVKDEPDDYGYYPSQYHLDMHGSSMQQNGQHYGSWHGGNNSIDPTELMDLQPTFGSQQNLSSSFIAGISGIGDEELQVDLPSNGLQFQQQAQQNAFVGIGNFNPNVRYGGGYFEETPGSVPLPPNPQNSRVTSSYSSDADPMQSSSMFDFNHVPTSGFPSHNQGFRRPQIPSSSRLGSLDAQMRAKGHRAVRTNSSSKSPITPRTPGAGTLSLRTPESGNFPGQPAQQMQPQYGHQRGTSSQWDDAPGSGHSYLVSPLSSPYTGPVQPQISELLKAVKPASVPARLDYGQHAKPGSLADAKKQRRRESHNLVERRRRENINDQIQKLSRLIPAHRLQDAKMDKHLNNNASLPASIIANSMSPPKAPSMLSGSAGRRNTGSITQGLPIEDKDAGPAKGEVLNGAVGWMRDLLWFVRVKEEHEAHLIEILEQLGLQHSLIITEDEQQMRSELLPILQRNEEIAKQPLAYSRARDLANWVPNFTDSVGPVHDAASPQCLEHGTHRSSTETNSTGREQQYWHPKDENELSMLEA